ncbi:MAG: acyl-CoA thioesterase [Megasphaera sp.]|jgi:acyl-CoA thioester hydrolase|nr:acyl-CoA thioesterase [Megasphaera sp.]MCH4187968.1 acyl-CoA thioesterase [Megasphaera sp.]MCH4217688.1 acyl-CoA thioesterase [Megasphaera sp.]
MITVTEKVRFYETDMMGIVHHSNQIRWFEVARCEYLRQAGIDLFELMDGGITFPIKHVSCEYISPINYGDTIAIEARLAKLSRAQMVFAYVISNTIDGTVMAEGTTQNVFTHKTDGTVARLDSASYAKLKACYDADLLQPQTGGVSIG